MVGASNSFNQIIERDIDALMDRTKNRPIPSNNISVNSAFYISVFLTLIGIIVLYKINPRTALFGAISIFIYTCLYTPLKPITPLSVFVGASQELFRLCLDGLPQLEVLELNLELYL